MPESPSIVSFQVEEIEESGKGEAAPLDGLFLQGLEGGAFFDEPVESERKGEDVADSGEGVVFCREIAL